MESDRFRSILHLFPSSGPGQNSLSVDANKIEKSGIREEKKAGGDVFILFAGAPKTIKLMFYLLLHADDAACLGERWYKKFVSDKYLCCAHHVEKQREREKWEEQKQMREALRP